MCIYTHACTHNSKCYHSLVQLVMGSESTSDMAAKEQAWTILEEVLNLMDQSKVCTCLDFRQCICLSFCWGKEGGGDMPKEYVASHNVIYIDHVTFCRRSSQKWRFCGFWLRDGTVGFICTG